jgi:exodeoxyribonuclease VII large subunit
MVCRTQNNKIVPDLFDEKSEDNILSVSEISQQIKHSVESVFPRVRVRGEVSGVKKHSSGHTYFSLKDQDSVLNAICWRSTKTGIALAEGLEIVATGRLSTYPGRSNYQMIISGAEMAGQGALLKLLQERKQKLLAEGLFDKKNPLPKFPQTIGVITSPTGAVIQDIIHRVADRYPCRIVLWPVAVQGIGAAEEIAAAISGMNALCPDVIIVARGGGSIEDLWAFNEECVVRAVYNSLVPIISAVGHETDITLIDFAADVRAPTPTAAAEMSTPVRSQVMSSVVMLGASLLRGLVRSSETKALRVPKLPQFEHFLSQKELQVDDYAERMIRGGQYCIVAKSQRLARAKILQPRFGAAETRLPLVGNAMNRGLRSTFDTIVNRFFHLSDRLAHSSYQATLERGFCLVTQGGSPVQSAAAMASSLNSSVQMHFCDGNIDVHLQQM